MAYIGKVPTAVPLSSADIEDGTIQLADLSATGTKDATTFLRGDNTFAEAGGGIEEVDMFALNDLNVNSFTQYTLTSSNTSRISSFSGTSFTKTGTGVSIDTNGKVTFPSTGQYLLLFQTYMPALGSDNARYLGALIRATNDNGVTITSRANAYNKIHSHDANTDISNAVAQLIFTVTDTTNDGVYFTAESSVSSSNVRLTGYDGTSKISTNFIVIKLA